MDLLWYFTVAFLATCITLQIVCRNFFATRITYFFASAAAVTAALLAYQSGGQYFEWLTAGPPTSYLLPPIAPISYFLFYIGTRFWLPHLLSLAFGGLAFLTAKYLNKKYDNRFFYPEEYYLIALGIFLSVHPLWLGFLVITALSYIGYAIAIALTRGAQARASFYYLWLPAALLITFLTPFLKTLPILSVFNL